MNELQQEIIRILRDGAPLSAGRLFERSELAENRKAIGNALYRLKKDGRLTQLDDRRYRLVTVEERAEAAYGAAVVTVTAEPEQTTDSSAPLTEYPVFLAPEMWTDAAAEAEPIPTGPEPTPAQETAQVSPQTEPAWPAFDLIDEDVEMVQPKPDPIEALLRANAETARRALADYAALQTDPVLSALKHGYDAATAALNSYLRRGQQ